MSTRLVRPIMAKPKKPTPVFVVKFDGTGIFPESIPFGTLMESLSAIRRLAAGVEAHDDEDGERLTEDPSSGAIRLIDVRRGSAVYRFSCPQDDGAVGNIRLAGSTLDDPDSLGDKDYMLNPIAHLSAAAKRIGCTIIVYEAGDKEGVLAKIQPDSYEHLSERLFIAGDTSFVGRVERVGGATANRCALRVAFQHRLLYCTVAGEDVSRQLGENLYQDVVVSGRAHWIKTTWRLNSFRVNSMIKLERVNLRDAIQRLRKAGGHGWDRFDDPRKKLEEVFSS